MTVTASSSATPVLRLQELLDVLATCAAQRRPSREWLLVEVAAVEVEEIVGEPANVAVVEGGDAGGDRQGGAASPGGQAARRKRLRRAIALARGERRPTVPSGAGRVPMATASSATSTTPPSGRDAADRRRSRMI
jgi:hypothetical protein